MLPTDGDLVFWPNSLDQPFLANQFSRIEKVGIELLQIRTGELNSLIARPIAVKLKIALGPAIGKATYRGPVVVGTDDAFARELKEAISLMDGEEGQRMRSGMMRIRKQVEQDREEGGRTWEALRRVGEL